MDNNNLIATLEQSLHQMRQSSEQKARKLREIEVEAQKLRQEIETLNNSSKQIETTMRTLLFDASANNNRNLNRYDNDPQDFDLQELANLISQKSAAQNPYQNSYQPPRPVSAMRHDNSKTPSINPDTKVQSYRFADRTIAQACTILLREAARPLHVNEVYNRLLENGFEFTGDNPTISIAVSLNRNSRFRKVAPGTFDLVMRDASQAAS